MPRTSAPWEHWPVFRHSATPLLATVLTFCFPPSRRQMDAGKPRAGVSTVTHSPASGTPLCVRKRGPRPTGEHTKCELRGTRRSRSRDRAPEVAVLPARVFPGKATPAAPPRRSVSCPAGEHGGPGGGEVRGGRRGHRGGHVCGAGRRACGRPRLSLDPAFPTTPQAAALRAPSLPPPGPSRSRFKSCSPSRPRSASSETA